MSIVVGSDFSEASSHALTAAAQLAHRMKLPLHLVHAVEVGQEQVFGEPPTQYAKWVADMLQRQAEPLRRADLHVDTHVRSLPADEALFDVARQVEARLIVVAASQRGERRALGSRADRIAARSHVPVLAIRDAKPFEAWTRGERPLRVVLGADLTQSGEAAMRWVNDLTSLGPCEIELVHLYWPPQQFERLGLSGVRSLIDPDTDVTRTLRHDFATRLAGMAGLQNVKFRLEPNLGRFDARLASIAAEHDADLVVVGAHGKNVTERIWEGSVSRGVLRLAASSVACVPLAADAAPAHPRRISSILVATDFSDVGNSAVQLAYAVAPAGALVHLVHVIPVSTDGFEPHDIFEPGHAHNAERAAAETRLRALVPAQGEGQQAGTVVHVLGSKNPAAAIAQAAERLDVDLLCLGTRGRGGMARALLGSQAQSVLGSTHRPVLFARAPLA
jgi:nucleotide-binding universal stress UspA family protein